MIRLLAMILALSLALPLSCALADDGVSSTYTYNYDYWGELRESPDAYRVDQVIYSATLGLETPMRKPQSLYVRDNDLYVCDTGNNRILQLRRDENGFSLVRIIDRIAGAEPETFNTPSDVSIDSDGMEVNVSARHLSYDIYNVLLGQCNIERATPATAIRWACGPGQRWQKRSSPS